MEFTFVGVTNLSVLERVLESETVYLELVQEETSGESVLAVFESSVRDLLFPRPAERLSYSGVDLDLLMEPTRTSRELFHRRSRCRRERASARPGRRSTSASRTPSASDTRRTGRRRRCSGRSLLTKEGRATAAVRVRAAAVAVAAAVEGRWCGARRSRCPCRRAPGTVRRPAGLAPLLILTINQVNCWTSSSPTGESSRGSGRRDEGPRPRFVYRRPDDDLLSRIPSSPTRNNKYLGIRSRYLSRSTGNLSDMPRTALPSRYGSRQGRTDSGGGLARTSSETEGGGGGYTHPRRRAKDDLGHDAHVTLVEPERCPHCDGEHGAESCTTCRTYHRYFPRPSRPRAHAHAYHTNNPQAALKVLRQPGRRDLRPRKRYLAEIDGALHGEALRHPRRARSLSPQRRPTSAPPDRLDLGHSRSRKDDDDDPSADEDEHESRSHSRSNSRSNSRSPSPPASHASAPATMTRRRQRSYRRPLTPSFRRRHDDSDDDLYDDLYIPRRYYHHHYPWEDCPLCYPDYPYLPRYPHLARYYHAHALPTPTASPPPTVTADDVTPPPPMTSYHHHLR
nr:serine/arginine repetitive matrix protein 2-like [Penaeus vannamei]